MRSRNIAIITAILLLIPVLGNRYVDGWNWTAFDFLFAGTLIFGSGLAFELFSRRGGTAAYRAAVGLSITCAFLVVWITGAVGIIGSEDNPINLFYLAVILLAIVGAVVARLKAHGMSVTMFTAAAATFLIPIGGLIANPQVLQDAPGVMGVFTLNFFFVLLWAGAGLLFLNSAKAKPVAVIA